jgi:hypothetical protein
VDAEIAELAVAADRLTPRGTAVVFGVCGRALAPLVEQVEQRSGGQWTVPDLGPALDLIRAFATGSAEAEAESEAESEAKAEAESGACDWLRARLNQAVSADEHPWSTFAQDVLICVDAGLAASSGDDRPQGRLIQFALEPLLAVLEDQDTELIRSYGQRHWRREISKDPAVATALGFLHELIAKASHAVSVDSHEFRALVGDAAVLRPDSPAVTGREAHIEAWRP